MFFLLPAVLMEGAYAKMIEAGEDGLYVEIHTEKKAVADKLERCLWGERTDSHTVRFFSCPYNCRNFLKQLTKVIGTQGPFNLLAYHCNCGTDTYDGWIGNEKRTRTWNARWPWEGLSFDSIREGDYPEPTDPDAEVSADPDELEDIADTGVLIFDKKAYGLFRQVGDTLTIPEGVTEIAPSAFSGSEFMEDVRTLVLPRTLKKIGKMAFYGCTALMRPDIPDSVKIGPEAFYLCRRPVPDSEEEQAERLAHEKRKARESENRDKREARQLRREADQIWTVYQEIVRNVPILKRIDTDLAYQKFAAVAVEDPKRAYELERELASLGGYLETTDTALYPKFVLYDEKSRYYVLPDSDEAVREELDSFVRNLTEAKDLSALLDANGDYYYDMLKQLADDYHRDPAAVRMIRESDLMNQVREIEEKIGIETYVVKQVNKRIAKLTPGVRFSPAPPLAEMRKMEIYDYSCSRLVHRVFNLKCSGFYALMAAAGLHPWWAFRLEDADEFPHDGDLHIVGSATTKYEGEIFRKIYRKNPKTVFIRETDFLRAVWKGVREERGDQDEWIDDAEAIESAEIRRFNEAFLEKFENSLAHDPDTISRLEKKADILDEEFIVSVCLLFAQKGYKRLRELRGKPKSCFERYEWRILLENQYAGQGEWLKEYLGLTDGTEEESEPIAEDDDYSVGIDFEDFVSACDDDDDEEEDSFKFDDLGDMSLDDDL